MTTAEDVRSVCTARTLTHRWSSAGIFTVTGPGPELSAGGAFTTSGRADAGQALEAVLVDPRVERLPRAPKARRGRGEVPARLADRALDVGLRRALHGFAFFDASHGSNASSRNSSRT